MLKPLLLVSAAFLLGMYPTPVPSPAPQQASAPKPASGPSARVKDIYKFDCAVCHGETGDGKTDLAKDMSLTMADFSDPKALEGKSDQQLFDLIRKGKDKMPPEESNRAKDEEVKGLIQYIKSMQKAQSAPAAVPAATPAETPAPAPATSPTGN